LLEKLWKERRQPVTTQQYKSVKTPKRRVKEMTRRREEEER